ncbi:hypothetical protein [Bacillus thuringiensis]|uniref:hypothetical protein n=1 Tax=Bacillus thuringiensis TaxID=1428 RepID=UPI003019C7CE
MQNLVLGDSAMSTMLTGIAGEVTSSIATVAPVAGGVIAAVVGINFGLKLFKKLTGARS